MLKNYIKIAIRSILKNPGYASINIFGLTVGITCFVLIYLTVQYELSFDRFHHDSEKVFRVDNTLKLSSGDYKYPQGTSAIGPAAVDQLPQVTEFTRLNGGGQEMIFEVDTEVFKETEIYFADSSFFDFFDFKVLYGSADQALNAPNKMVLTQTAALKYFGKENAVGEVLVQKTGQADVQFNVTAVMEDLPSNTHMLFDVLIANETQRNFQNGNFLNSWGNVGFITYIRLNDPSSADAVEQALIDIKTRNVAEQNQMNINPTLIAMNDIHLYSNLRNEMQPNGNINFVYIFSATALFILLIAAINYMNLATARSAKRAKEVGMRKVLGAHKKQLITQFLGESLVLTLISTVISLVIAALFIKDFGELVSKELNSAMVFNPGLFAVLAVIILIIGLGSGSYPALFLSSFRPVVVLKGKLVPGMNSSGLLRKGLVVFQFTISIIMMIGTYVVYSQLTFMQNKSLGFQKEDMLVVSNTNNAITQQLNAFRNEVLTIPGVEGMGASFSKPGGLRPIIFMKSETVPNDDGNFNMAGINIDFGYMSTLGIRNVSGRVFDRTIPTDSTESIMVNAQGVKELNLTPEEAVGRMVELNFGGNWIKKRIIGVVEDINFEPLQRPTEATFYGPLFPAYSFIYLKLNPDVPAQQTINQIGSLWGRFSVTQPFEYSFLEQDLNQLYESEEELSQVIIYFSILAIAVACLGLFGLASFSTEQRIKEIGVRKVLGASVAKILFLLSKDFATLIIIAFIIGGSAAYFLKDLWLQDFAFQTSVGPMTFILSGVMALFIALLTVSYKTVKAARANPIKAIRHE